MNEDGTNLRELLMPTNNDELDKDLFIPDNSFFNDLNVSIFG